MGLRHNCKYFALRFARIAIMSRYQRGIGLFTQFLYFLQCVYTLRFQRKIITFSLISANFLLLYTNFVIFISVRIYRVSYRDSLAHTLLSFCESCGNMAQKLMSGIFSKTSEYVDCTVGVVVYSNQSRLEEIRIRTEEKDRQSIMCYVGNGRIRKNKSNIGQKDDDDDDEY